VEAEADNQTANVPPARAKSFIVAGKVAQPITRKADEEEAEEECAISDLNAQSIKIPLLAMQPRVVKAYPVESGMVRIQSA
jgi:hypothetical protein